MPSESLLLHFDQTPRAIVAAMDGLRSRSRESQGALEGSWRVPVGLIATGFALLFLDQSLGYRSRIFTFAAIAFLLIGLGAAIAIRRAGRQPTYRHSGFAAARHVIHTLRDDLAPKRNLHGTLDLTGARDERKRSRTKKDTRGRTVSYYRDDWLAAKAKLYDGSMLRFAVVHRIKVRDAYWKRGRVSGKRKRKPALVKSDAQYVDIRVSANPALYTVSRDRAPAIGELVGRWRVDSVSVEGGLLRVTASNAAVPTGQEILDLLLLTYGTLQRSDVA